jgi:outer membrane protein assembly factor BamE (lipoprotein component of BamABCDE complex)
MGVALWYSEKRTGHNNYNLIIPAGSHHENFYFGNKTLGNHNYFFLNGMHERPGPLPADSRLFRARDDCRDRSKRNKKGMSAAEVADALGSPNIVTTDSERREVWIYDKISTDVTYSKDTGSLLVALFAGGPLGGGVGGALGMGDYNRSAGAKSTTQRTLTVVIKFDNENKVRDFAYHASKF